MLFSIFAEKQHTMQTNSIFLKFSSSLDNMWSKLYLHKPLNMRLWTISNISTINRAIFCPPIVGFFYTFWISFLSTSSSLKWLFYRKIKISNSIWTIPFTLMKVCYFKENMQLFAIPFTSTAKWYLKVSHSHSAFAMSIL